ncbi:hypothetical protein [Thiomicrorhabdus chilensis]|uniref:hypothetical protein n=1 Tax=Thiomicrorhabdus chilensis TaxID=63656 RepID=UPI00041EBAE7|nr:hypothetical protein [Thiomicrorhabdus chilensis]
MKTAMLLIMSLLSFSILSGCENAELKTCIDQQSGLWDSSSNDPNANRAYWKAVENCKNKYD